MITKQLLKGIAAGSGLGLGVMYLGNEGEGESFTSYPREARYKRLLRGEQIPFPGLEGNVPLQIEKDRFGYGIPSRNAGTVGMFDGQSQKDHAIIFGKFIQPYNKNFGMNELAMFMQASVPQKEEILKQYAGDTDDALWKSEEWMRISDARRPK